MTDPFRGGGFDRPGMGPFGGGGWGGDAAYLRADDGDNVAATKKYSAQIAWANGTITDDQYLGALRAFLNTTDKGSRERTSAQNEYDDAVYTIGRNKLVRGVNNATTSALRVAALRRLIGYDRQKLSGMKRDNEQYRELVDRISDAESQVRTVRYGDLVRRFNAGEVGIGALLSFSRQAAIGSKGGPDHQDWLDKVREWQDREVTERINQLYQDFEMERIPGSTVIGALKDRLSGLSQDSPQYAETQRAIEDLSKNIQAKEWADADSRMDSRLRNGTVSNAEYLRYLQRRINDYPKGSSDRRAAQDRFLSSSFSLGEDELRSQMESGEADATDMIGFYRSFQSTMSPGTARFLEIQAKITDLMIAGAPALDIGVGNAGGYVPGGHWVSLTGAPGGTPVNAEGFASQFDGSTFASNNCGMASAAMMAWAASGGKVRVSGGDLRYYSGDRNEPGDDVGTTFDDIAIAYEQVGLGLEQKHGMSFNQWKRRLMQGEGSLINGHYLDAPPNLRLTNSANFTHTMYVDRAKRMQDGKVWFFVMDPLGRAGYSGQWWPEEAVKAYGWSGRANAGGGTWFGDVAFAAKRGRSSTYIRPDRDPTPYQAFDTDADGNSTIGRGGGTNREEAGPRRDWSKGRKADAPASWPQWQLPDKGGRARTTSASVTEDQVTEFLAAVDAVERPRLDRPTEWGVQAPVDPGDPNARRARAKAILGEWSGDARLAAVAWFTGSAQPDAARWGSTERFYANAVGTRLGYEPVRKGGGLLAGPGLTSDPIEPMLPPGAVSTVGPRPEFQQDRALEGVPTETADLGRRLLDALGVEATPDLVRAVVAWIAASGDKVKGNNPGGLHTTGQQDLPGQVAKDGSSLAVFGSVEDGIAAWAAEIRRNAPQVIAAARTGDPERFLVAVDRSGWVEGGYGGALVRTFNEIPGEAGRVIVGGGQRVLDGPADLAALARQEPGIAELFDVDPRDPVQMAWLDANVASARRAFEAGAPTWEFVAPGGQRVEMGFAPSMMGDITGIKATYLRWTYETAPDNASRLSASKAWESALADHNEVVTEVATDEWRSHLDALDSVRQAALGSLDYATYLNATKRMADATKLFLGLDPAGPLDPDQSPRAALLKDAGVWDDVIRMGDSLEVRSTDDIATLNPDGDPILELWASGYLQVQRDRQGNVVAATPNPDTAYIAWNGGKLQLRTNRTHPDDFLRDGEPTVGLDRSTVEPPPRYLQENVLMTLGGASGYAKRDTSEVRGVILTSSGYRRTVLPEPTTRTYTIGPGRGIGSTAGRVIQQSPAGTRFTGAAGRSAAAGRVIDVTTPQDRMIATVGQMIPVEMVNVLNPFTDRLETWYSIPGSGRWVGGETNSPQRNPPTLVLDQRVGLGPKGLTVDGEEYDAAKHGGLSGLSHWYGDRVSDGAAPGEYGAQGTRYRVRQGLPTPGGGVMIDTAPPDAGTAFVEGDIPFSAMLPGGTPRAGRPGPSFPGKDDVAAPPRGATIKAAPDGQVTTVGLPGSGAWAGQRAMQGLADAGFFGPQNAGAKADPRLPGSAKGLATFGSRLAATVRASATQAQAVADAARQRAIAEQQAAATRSRLEAAARAAAAREANLAKVKATVDWNVVTTSLPRVDTPKPSPKPRPTPAPAPSPAPTPAPTPAPKPPTLPRGPQGHGMY